MLQLYDKNDIIFKLEEKNNNFPLTQWAFRGKATRPQQLFELKIFLSHLFRLSAGPLTRAHLVLTGDRTSHFNILSLSWLSHVHCVGAQQTLCNLLFHESEQK